MKIKHTIVAMDSHGNGYSTNDKEEEQSSSLILC